MREIRFEILRNNIPIGELLCRSASIKYNSAAEVMRGMQCDVYADRQNMYSITAKVRDWIYFDGSRCFDGTWSFLGSVYETTSYNFDMFRDRVRPVLSVDGVDHSLGVFMIINAPKELSETGSYYDLECYDETMLLKQAATTDRLYFAAGTVYLDAVEQLLTSVGFANIVADANAEAMQISREFEAGTTYLSIINTLLQEINYDPVHAGTDGYIYLTAKAQRTEADFIYADRKKFSLIGQIQTETDIYNKPNVLVGVLSNPQQTPVVYTRENNDLNSVLSIARRGYRVVKIYRLSNIASESAMQAYIDAKLVDSMQATETVSFETAIESGHEYRATVQLATDMIDGLYTETEYQIDIRPGAARMRHRAERRMFI